jgi:hypothetical protein
VDELREWLFRTAAVIARAGACLGSRAAARSASDIDAVAIAGSYSADEARAAVAAIGSYATCAIVTLTGAIVLSVASRLVHHRAPLVVADLLMSLTVASGALAIAAYYTNPARTMTSRRVAGRNALFVTTFLFGFCIGGLMYAVQTTPAT